jgi:hypothetical protein
MNMFLYDLSNDKEKLSQSRVDTISNNKDNTLRYNNFQIKSKYKK